MRVFEHVLCPDSDRLRNEVCFLRRSERSKVFTGNPVPVPAEIAPIKAEQCRALIGVHGINETFGRSISKNGILTSHS
jgi:hypothetical protein